MAKGITNRTRLSLPPVAPDLGPLARNLDRWANNLPFGSVGFHFRRATSDAAVADNNDSTITWTVVVEDRENWMPLAGSTTSITVPPGLSGLYMITFGMYIGAAIANWYPWVRVNGDAITDSPAAGIDHRVWVQTVPALLSDGDVLTAGFYNDTGANAQATHIAGDGRWREVPYLQAWRIALL